jgi:hypothetical protein
MPRETEYEVDEPDILDGGCAMHEDRQGFVDVGQVGAAADCGGLKAHGLDHHGLVQNNGLLLSLVPEAFEVAYGDFHPE